jgi:purine nucleoside phosphorylase
MSTDIGLILGSGLSYLDLAFASRSPTKTPYGTPSSPLLAASFGDTRLHCIARHGESGKIPPHAVNYRANLWSLREMGVNRCVAINSVGSIDPAFPPGELAVPDQLVDYTWGREHTLYDGNSDELAHIDFTEPFDPELRGRIASAIVDCGYRLRGGVCGVTQGPRLETAAEIDRLARDGCTMVGMTLMPEAAIARELGLAYGACAVSVNHAAGRGQADAIHAEFEQYATLGMQRASTMLDVLIKDLLEND